MISGKTAFDVALAAGLAAFAAAIAAIKALAGKLAYRHVRAIADELGVACEVPVPILGVFYPFAEVSAEGAWRGWRLQVYVDQTRRGRRRVLQSVLSVQTRADPGLAFAFSRRGLGAGPAEDPPGTEVLFDDPAFDRWWRARGSQPEFLRAALLPELREKMAAAARAGARGAIELENGELSYVEAGAFQDHGCRARFVQLADILGDLAAVAEVFAP